MKIKLSEREVEVLQLCVELRRVELEFYSEDFDNEKDCRELLKETIELEKKLLLTK